MNRFNFFTALTFLILIIPFGSTWAHGEEKHENASSSTAPDSPKSPTPSMEGALSLINQAYLKEVKPIFQKKCFDCHSRFTKFPWYYAIPGIKHLMDRDIRVGSSHVEMSDDFPFKSHSSSLGTLFALRTVAKEKSMPPFQYLLGHWSSRLTDEDQKVIVQWTTESIEILKKEK